MEKFLVTQERLNTQACTDQVVYPGAGGLVPDETHFLNSIHDILQNEKTPADELLSCFNGNWDGNLKKIYEDYSY